MGSFGNFLGGLLVGAAVGVVAVVFAAPKSGDETREDITSIWNGAIETGKGVAKRREEELWADFNVRVKSKADVLSGTAPTNTTSSTTPSAPSGNIRTYQDPA